MCLYMLLEILRALEGLSAEFTSMWFQRDVDPNVGSDVVALDDGDMAITPCALQIEIVGTLPPNVTVANMFLNAVLVFTVDVETWHGRNLNVHRGLQRWVHDRCSLPTDR